MRGAVHKLRSVIPGRHRKVASPESITLSASGYGFRGATLRRRPGMTLRMIRNLKTSI